MLLSLREIIYQMALRSSVFRRNFTELKNFVNNLQAQLDASLTPPVGSEVPNARDYHSILRDRLRSGFASLGGPAVRGPGGKVTAQPVPDMTVNISGDEGIVSGIGVIWEDSVSDLIVAPTNKRMDVVVINSDGTIEVIPGNDSNDPILPDITDQIPRSIIKLTSATTAITNADIFDASGQGAWVNGKWFWKPEDAVAALPSSGGTIHVGPGEYYGEIDLSGLSNISIKSSDQAKYYRVSNSYSIIKSVNTFGNEESNIQIIGGRFFGNGKAGANEIFRFEYTDELVLKDVRCDGNASSTAPAKDLAIENCDDVLISAKNLDKTITDSTDVKSIGSTVKVSAYSGFTVPVSSTADTPIVVPSVRAGSHTAYDTATGVFTTPKGEGGRYIVSVSALSSLASGQHIYYSINGEVDDTWRTEHMIKNATSTTAHQIANTFQVDLEEGDTLDIRNNVGALTFYEMRFEIYRLAA